MAITNHWRSHVEAWQSSGLSQAAYCRQHQPNSLDFTARLSEYRIETGEGKPVPIPVTVTVASSEFNPKPKRIVLHCVQGHRLELPGTVSAQWMSALLRGLSWSANHRKSGWRSRRWISPRGTSAAEHRRFVNDCPTSVEPCAVFGDGICVPERGGEPVALTGMGRQRLSRLPDPDWHV